MDKPAIRDAATVILYRKKEALEVLMGMRGAGAAFMPSKFVFPGGAVDPGDRAIPLAGLPAPVCLSHLAADAAPDLAHALVAAAIRETWEETGLVLGVPDSWRDPPDDWQSFAATGHRPSGAGLRFVFRAITPPGRPRRFDARFFLADAGEVRNDIEDFSAASGELSALQWVPVADAMQFNLPFITEVVLAEIARQIRVKSTPDAVPFFFNDDTQSRFRRISGT